MSTLSAKHNSDFKAWKSMLAAIQAVCVLMVWAQFERDCFITQTIAHDAAVGSPFVSNSTESVAQFEHGDFKFESPEYQ